MTTFDLTNADQVQSYMKQAASEEDWNARCDAVKSANNGYPSFWYPAIVMSGLMARVTAKF